MPTGPLGRGPVSLSLEWVAFFHTAGAFMILAFFIVHVYLTTTGHTVTSHIKAMITGWEGSGIILGMGCFWGAEKRMSEVPGVVDVESGYANGDIAGSYDAVLKHERVLRLGRTGKRNHAEVVKVIYDPARTSLETVLARFWEQPRPHPGRSPGATTWAATTAVPSIRIPKPRLDVAEKKHAPSIRRP
jgi:hypothetical protein